MKLITINNMGAEKFVSCRVGLELADYREDLAQVLHEFKIYGLSREPVNGETITFDETSRGNFIVTPITSPRFDYFYAETDLLPDLCLPRYRWENEIAVSINLASVQSDFDQAEIDRFEKLFRHALYLPTSVIVIDSPQTREANKIVAKVVNEQLEQNHTQRLILFRVTASSSTNDLDLPVINNQAGDMNPQRHIKARKLADGQMLSTGLDDSSSESGYSRDNEQASSQGSAIDRDELIRGWTAWDNLRSYLAPDHRIGVCLLIEDDFDFDDFENTSRWKGEPVRMIVLSMDSFSCVKGFRNTMRPAGAIKEFIKLICVSNSLLTSLVVKFNRDFDVQDYLNALSKLCDSLDSDFPDHLRPWDDVLLDPLQPLSSNLDSQTYSIFEQDEAKYCKYHEAMVQALGCLLKREESTQRFSFTLMILGAGRGPLVDQLIKAIHKLKLRRKEFKIYVLDKNHSSVTALKYKKRHHWDSYKPAIETIIVHSDMRTWMPEEKADMVATELLGSFSDNELSPECLDGTWRFCTPQTICIPQSYSSHIAPISSYKLRQQLYMADRISCREGIFDRIYVTRFRNHFMISQPQSLFTFSHTRLDLEPRKGSNERAANLEFTAKVEAVCHGFAGYFSAQLFGDVFISTEPNTKTQSMDSWFPVFVPIEKPVKMRPGSSIEVKFQRRENDDRVWYEWSIVGPKSSRIHCKDGNGGWMSKII